MTFAMVSVTSDVIDDGHYEVTLAQTGLDTADINIRKWTLGSDYTAAPASESSYNLASIRSRVGSFVCTTEAFLQTADITFSLSAPGMVPSVSVNVTHTWFSNADHVYPISAADYADVQAFLAAAAFPIG